MQITDRDINASLFQAIGLIEHSRELTKNHFT